MNHEALMETMHIEKKDNTRVYNRSLKDLLNSYLSAKFRRDLSKFGEGVDKRKDRRTNPNYSMISALANGLSTHMKSM